MKTIDERIEELKAKLANPAKLDEFDSVEWIQQEIKNLENQKKAKSFSEWFDEEKGKFDDWYESGVWKKLA